MLAQQGESYYVEYKTCWDYGPDGRRPRDIREVARDIGQTIVAFANSEGGDLLVGVEDSGSITGVPWEDDRLQYLVQAARHQIRHEEEAADLRAQKDIHRSRNPVIMRVLRDLGWTRDQGEGMRRIFGSMRQ